MAHLNPTGHFDIYLTGGGGEYHWFQEFTQPAVARLNAFDPFSPSVKVAESVNPVLGLYSVNKPGIAAGAGAALGTRFHGKSFPEARYNRIFLRNGHVDYILSFGFRW